MTAYDIAECYTLEEIDTQIASLKDAYTGAAGGGYTLDTTQGRQSVTVSSVKDVSRELGLWLKARRIKTGTYTGTQIVYGNYTP